LFAIARLFAGRGAVDVRVEDDIEDAVGRARELEDAGKDEKAREPNEPSQERGRGEVSMRAGLPPHGMGVSLPSIHGRVK